MAGRGRGLGLPASDSDQANDSSQYPSLRDPEPESLIRRSLTRYYVTVHTGWLNDATSDLRFAIHQEATTRDNQHIGNHQPTRTRELANLRTSALRDFLDILINEVAQNRLAAARSLPPRFRDTTAATAGDPDLDEFIATDTCRNPYAGIARGTPAGEGRLTRPALVTLAMIFDRAWLIAPDYPSFHRRELPFTTAVALSPLGVQQLQAAVHNELAHKATPRRMG